MSGYLYAVIFEQGTVKVGLTRVDPGLRIACHRREGEKFGVSVANSMSKVFDTKHLELFENALCGYCLNYLGTTVGGNEWFKFSSVEEASQFIEEAFEKIEKGDLKDFYQKNYRYNHNFFGLKVNMALDLVRQGKSVPEAAGMMALDTRSIYMRKAYKEWAKQQGENK